MSKKTGPTRIRMSDFRERKELEGAIDIETDDGQTFRLPPPELWPDEVGEHARAGDLAAMGKVLLGADKYEAFVAAGGSGAMLNGIFMEVHGADAS